MNLSDFDFEDFEEVDGAPSAVTSSTILRDLKRGDVVRVGRVRYEVFQTHGIQIYAYRAGTSGRKMYRIMPAGRGESMDAEVVQIDGCADPCGTPIVAPLAIVRNDR